jgi:hypothetical protein
VLSRHAFKPMLAAVEAQALLQDAIDAARRDREANALMEHRVFRSG